MHGHVCVHVYLYSCAYISVQAYTHTSTTEILRQTHICTRRYLYTRMHGKRDTHVFIYISSLFQIFSLFLFPFLLHSLLLFPLFTLYSSSPFHSYLYFSHPLHYTILLSTLCFITTHTHTLTHPLSLPLSSPLNIHTLTPSLPLAGVREGSYDGQKNTVFHPSPCLSQRLD